MYFKKLVEIVQSKKRKCSKENCRCCKEIFEIVVKKSGHTIAKEEQVFDEKNIWFEVEFCWAGNESERLIRSWISPLGRSVHLEIAGASIFTLRTYITENQWHHICQSWDNAEGRYAMWIDGRIVIQGLAPQVRSFSLPAGFLSKPKNEATK